MNRFEMRLCPVSQAFRLLGNPQLILRDSTQVLPRLLANSWPTDLHISKLNNIRRMASDAAGTTSLFRLKLLDAFHEHVADYREALGADFVESVLWGVPVRNLQVDDVDRTNAAGRKGLVIVFDGARIVHENSRITQVLRDRPHQIGEHFVGIGV